MGGITARRFTLGDPGEREAVQPLHVTALAEGEGVGLDARIQEGGLEGALGNGAGLPDELVEPWFGERAVALVVDVGPVGGARRLPVEGHPEPARRRRPRRARARPGRGARHGGRDRASGRWPAPRRGGCPAAAAATPIGRPPSAPADAGTAPWCRTRADRRRHPASPPAPGSRAARQRATPAPDHRPARPPRPATALGCRPGARPAAAGSSPRPAPGAAARRGGRTRPPAPTAASSAAVPAAPAGCHASRRRSGHGPGVQRAGHHRVQQRARIGLLQSLDHQLRQPRQLAAGNARREDQADWFRRQAARHEAKDMRRGTVQPLPVIDQAEQHRRAQLVHPGEGELQIGLDTGDARHPAAKRLLGQVVQQGRLAHTRLPADHQGPALTGPNRVEEPLQQIAFAASAPQLPGGSTQARRWASHEQVVVRHAGLQPTQAQQSHCRAPAAWTRPLIEADHCAHRVVPEICQKLKQGSAGQVAVGPGSRLQAARAQR
jgi:hypothetical protein